MSGVNNIGDGNADRDIKNDAIVGRDDQISARGGKEIDKR